MARVKKIEEPLEAPEVLAVEETVAPAETPAQKAKEAGAPDSITAFGVPAFKAMTFDHKEWYVYACDGRRVSSALTEDEAVRLVRGFGVK